MKKLSKLIEDPKLFPNENEIDTKREKVLPIVEYINNITLVGLGCGLFVDEKLQMLYKISNVECIKLRKYLHNKKSPVKDIFQSFDERYMSNKKPILIG